MRWDTITHGKHVRLRRHVRRWERSIAKAESAQPRSASQYNPALSDEQIRRLEMECALGEAGHLIGESQNGNVTTFWREVDLSDFPDINAIGVSNGEHTNFIFVVVQSDGSVHGYPITRDELIQKKGVRFDA